jgi:type VI secretion system protein ImpH
MATTSRSKDPDVSVAEPPRNSSVAAAGALVMEELLDSPWEFEFFQAVRLLERFGTGKPVGQFANPQQEIVRFATNPDLQFPASRIDSLEKSASGQLEMTVNFLGLTGPSGALPRAYSEFVNERLRARDVTLKAFLDIFNHRAISMFYAAWEKYRFSVAYERDQHDRLTQYLLDFIGLGSEGLKNRQSVPDHSLVYYTGLLGLQPRSAAALEQVLADYFDVSVEIEQFVGAWHRLSVEDQCSVGDQERYSEQLGMGAIAGDEIWDRQSRARIVLGPLSLEQYLDFLPNGAACEPLRAIVKFFSNEECDFEVRLILQREDVPDLDLGGAASNPMLGWTTWVKNAPFGRDPGDTVLNLN